VTDRLVQILVKNWEDFDGYAVAHNMPPLTDMPLDRLVNWVWWRMCENRNEQDILKLRAQIWMPPPEAEPEAVDDTRSPWNPKNEMDAFSAFKSQLGVAKG
jgi:hypothetical protein